MALRFADCVFDPATREVWRAGRRVELAPQAYALLSLLVRHRPRPVRHEELRDALWPDAIVAHTALPRVVSELRQALGDSAEREDVIRTVPRYGYAFVAPVAPDPASIRAGEWLLVTDRAEFALPPGETLVGRGRECAVRIDSPQVSRVHARVLVTAEGVLLEDCGSKNGTFLNGVRLSGPATVREADEVCFGICHVTFRRSTPDASTRSAIR